METRKLADTALTLGREMKQHLWTEHHVHDAPPLATLFFRDFGPFDPALAELAAVAYEDKWLPDEIMENEGFLATLMSFIYHQIRTGNLPEEFEQRPDPDDRLEAFVAVCDSYVALRGRALADPDLRGSKLEDDFKSNPRSEVQEAVIVFAYTEDMVGGCDYAATYQTYSITDGGTLKWGEARQGLPGEDAIDDHPFTLFAKDVFKAQGV